MTVLEASIAALVASLNTGTPAGVPTFERDRWVDVDLDVTVPTAVLSGWEDAPHEGQDEDRVLDIRRARLVIELYVRGVSGGTPSQAADLAVEWIGTKCGPNGAIEMALAQAGIIRLLMLKKAAIAAKGNVCRCMVELAMDYRNFVNDLTRAK